MRGVMAVRQGACTTLPAWVKEVSGCWPLALPLERLRVCGENGSDDCSQRSKEGIFCCLCQDSVKRSTHKPLLPPSSRILLPGHGTPRACSAKHTSPSALYCQPFLFSPSVKFLFVCLNAQTPQLSSLSVPIGETKFLCYGATFWDKKGRLLITSLLDHWNQSLT